MEFTLNNEALNILGLVITIIGPIILYRMFVVLDRSRTEKNIRSTEELKDNNEKIAQNLKLASADIVENLRIKLDVKNDLMLKNISTNSSHIQDLIDRMNKVSSLVDELSKKQSETQKDQLTLISDLQHRADMTNGNIENIRNDIMDIQDTADDISDRVPLEKVLVSKTSSAQTANAILINNRRRKRRAKRKQIDFDAQNQGMAKLNIGMSSSDVVGSNK